MKKIIIILFLFLGLSSVSYSQQSQTLAPGKTLIAPSAKVHKQDNKQKINISGEQSHSSSLSTGKKLTQTGVTVKPLNKESNNEMNKEKKPSLSTGQKLNTDNKSKQTK